MTHGHSLTLLQDIGLSIIFATVCAHIARLLRQPLMLGYVAGGILLGTHLGFGFVQQEASIELISEIGLILLLFIIGLEINLRELLKMGRKMLILGTAQFAGCVLIGLLLLRAVVPSAGGQFDLLYLAVAAALSSTLIVVKLLHEKFEIHTTTGRLTVGVLVLQDLWAIFFIAFQPNLQNPGLWVVARSIGASVLLVALAFGISRFLLSRIFAAVSKNPELVLLTSVTWCFVLCGAGDAAGLSKEMGALVAGLSIAAFPYGMDVIAKLVGVRDFFVTLFFVSLGLKMPQPTLALMGASFFVLGAVLLSRFLSIVPTLCFLGYGTRIGIVTAVNLSQVSEFSLVILTLGATYGHVSSEVQSLVLSSMLLTSLVSPYLIMGNSTIAKTLSRFFCFTQKLREKEQEEAESPSSKPDILLLGCFREGLVFLDTLEKEAPELKSRLLAVDFNAALQAPLAARGFKWCYGDLSHPETLEHAGIHHASVILCSLSDTYLKGTNTERLLSQLRKMAPHAKMIMMADDAKVSQTLKNKGAEQVVVGSELAGRELFHALSALKNA